MSDYLIDKIAWQKTRIDNLHAEVAKLTTERDKWRELTERVNKEMAELENELKAARVAVYQAIGGGE